MDCLEGVDAPAIADLQLYIEFARGRIGVLDGFVFGHDVAGRSQARIGSIAKIQFPSMTFLLKDG